MNLNQAYRKVHFPDSFEEYQRGKTRLDIEKLVPLAIKNLNQKIYFAGNRGHLYHNLDKYGYKFIDIDEKGLWVNSEETIDEWDIKHSLTHEWLGTADMVEVYNTNNNRLIVHFLARHVLSIFLFEKPDYKTLSITETDLVNV